MDLLFVKEKKLILREKSSILYITAKSVFTYFNYVLFPHSHTYLPFVPSVVALAFYFAGSE